jgi:hypothetical protein
MSDLTVSISEIVDIINLGQPIPKTKGELLETICAFEPKYIKILDQLLYLSLNTLTGLIYSLLESKYPNKKTHPLSNREIVITEDIIYY